MSLAPMVVEVRTKSWRPGEVRLFPLVWWPTLQPELSHSHSTRYRGCRILARPYRLSESGLWTVDLEIRDNGRRRSFSPGTRYLTEAEAGDGALEAGRRIVDGKEPRWSTETLHHSRSRFAAARRVATIVLLGIGAVLLLAAAGGLL